MAKRSHGLSRDAEGKKTPEYRAWSAIKQRCYNPKCAGYEGYGGRGITMCDEWRESFEQFYADMGPKPSPSHSIEREKNDEPYSAINCKWATKSEQSRNQRDRLRVMRKTDSLLLKLVPQLRDKGFSLRSIAALFGVGPTLIEKVARGDYEGYVEIDGKVFTEEKRKVNHPVKRIRRTPSAKRSY